LIVKYILNPKGFNLKIKEVLCIVYLCTALINYSEHALRNVCLLLTRIKRKVKDYYKYVLIVIAQKTI